MELGLRVENTPFTPIFFPDEKSISLKKILNSFNDKLKTTRIVFFTPHQLLIKKSSVKIKQFRLGRDGFPDSADFLLFKLFVAQSLVENRSFDIVVVCTYNYSASSYVIVRWLIDERGMRLSQALQAMKKAIKDQEIDFGLSEKLKDRYSFVGTPIYGKTTDLPIINDEKEIEINMENNSNIDDDSFSLYQQDDSDDPKRKPPKPPPLPKFGLQPQLIKEVSSENPIKSQKINKIQQNQPVKSSQSIKSQLAPRTKQKNPDNYIVNSKRQHFPFYDITLSQQQIKTSPQKQTKYDQNQQSALYIKQQQQINNDQTYNFPYQLEQINILNELFFPQQVHHHHRHHHIPQKIPFEEVNYQQQYQYSYNQDSYDQDTKDKPSLYYCENSIPNNNPQDSYNQIFPNPPSNYPPTSNYYQYESQNHPDIYQGSSYNYQNDYYSNYNQTRPQQNIPSYRHYDAPPDADSYNFPPQYPRMNDYYLQSNYSNTNNYSNDYPYPHQYQNEYNNYNQYNYNYQGQYQFQNPKEYHDSYYNNNNLPLNVPMYQYHPDEITNNPHGIHAPPDQRINYQYPDKNDSPPPKSLQQQSPPLPPKNEQSFQSQDPQKKRHEHSLSLNPQVLKSFQPLPPPPLPQNDKPIDLPLSLRPQKDELPLSLHPNPEKLPPVPPTVSTRVASMSKDSNTGALIPLLSGSFLNGSEEIESDNSNSEEMASLNSNITNNFQSTPSIDNEYQIFTRIPIVRVGEDTSPDEYIEVCKDIASILSIKNLNVKDIQSLPFTHEEQLTKESFNIIKNCANKSIMFRPIPAGVRCFLVARGSKRFLISDEMCREIKLTLVLPAVGNNFQPVTKLLFEGFLIRHEFNRKTLFLITDCFCIDEDLSNLPYKERLEEAEKLIELQQSRSTIQDSIFLRLTDIFQINLLDEIENKFRFDFEVLGFYFFSPDSIRQSELNQFNFNESFASYQIDDSECLNRIFRWFRDGCPIVEINISNSMKCIGLAKRNNSDELVEAVDFGYAKKQMLRFNKKIVELEYSANLSKWQIKCVSSKYETWYADDVKSIVCGKEVMPYEDVKCEVDELISNN